MLVCGCVYTRVVGGDVCLWVTYASRRTHPLNKHPTNQPTDQKTVAVITGLVLRNLGEDKQPRAFSDILGALFFHTMAMGLFPYASQSLFLYDRQFYQSENGGKRVHWREARDKQTIPFQTNGRSSDDLTDQFQFHQPLTPPTTTTTARLYPPSAYYCANLTLELLLNAGNGSVYALISYYMLNYQAYVQAPNPALSAFGFIGLVTLTNVVANVRA